MFEMLGEFSGRAKNTSEFGKRTALAVLSQSNTSLFNQTTKPITGIFGSTAVAPVFGVSCQTPTAHPKFKGFNADGTCSLFGTPTETSTSKSGLIGQQNASMGEKTGGGCFDSSNSKTSFQQSKPVETPLAQPTSNIFAAPQTSTAGNGIFGASTTVLGQTKTSIFNQTTQPNMGIFGSTAVVPVFGVSCQTPTAHPKFKGFNADGTCSLFGTPTETSTPKSGLIGQQNASMDEKTGGGCFDSSNSKTLFQQSKPVETPLAQPTSNIFAAPQTSTAGNGIFGASTTVLGQTITSIFNQTTQPNMGIFGSTAVAPVFGVSCQTPTAHPNFEGFNADGTCSLFGTPTETSTSKVGLIGQQNASMGEKTGGGCFDSSNSKTSFQQSKPVETPLAQPTSNIFAAPQTSTAGNGIFGASTTVLGQTKASIINQTTQLNTGIFGSTAVVPVFGVKCQTPTTLPIFEGFNADGTCSLFRTPTATSKSNGGLFGQQNASMGEKTGGMCFGSINSFQQLKPSGTPLAQSTSNIFAAPQIITAGTGIFGTSTTGHATSGFGATSADGTAIKFNPVTGTDTCVINGVVHKINTSHQSITVMKEYETKAFEELRFEYYFANRKVEHQGAVDGRIFESPKTLFSSTITLNTDSFRVNDNNSLYGATSTTPILLGDVMTKIQLFAAPQTNIFGTTAPSTFVTQTTGFGQTGFEQPNQNNLFGQNKPAFGLGSTQTTGFGFGTNTFTSAHGIFGSKPNSGFHMTSSAFGTDNTFGATSTAQPATRGLFSSKAFTEAQTTSLFNQTTNNVTGVFNATSSGGKWKKNTRNEGTGLFGSNKQTGKLGLFGK
ncbi:nuclear pore complex protein DDB_G0274915-like isoform X4 [Metopolophium dirhodum]|uniref:nuclear pore complex protein DDB_G0274915-like isoform X4 n=1 Tax=Metopolophium dirhodum TaxID=44670 RepID=UPI00298F5A98|nr:nuclear pore complex protein DDB_G0274915-like isoform X4 [Metopolophium dirhodum]